MILCYWYQKHEMTVRWGACISDSFNVTNGVRQGGILSSQLFNIYIDGLSDILNKSSIGGSIGGKRINRMLYTDDLCIVSLSSAGLLSSCDQYCAMHSITFNVKKSVCTFFRCSMNKQGWQPAFTAGIIRRLKPDKAGPDNTPKSGFYRLLLAFTIFLLFSTTKTVLTISYVY